VIRERPLVLTGQAFVGRRRSGGAVVSRLVRALYVYLLQDKPAKVGIQLFSIHYYPLLTLIFIHWTAPVHG